MSVDEIENEIAKKPQPAPRTHKREPEKPVEEMSIDEMMKVAEEPNEENGPEVKSPREIVDSSSEVLCMNRCYLVIFKCIIWISINARCSEHQSACFSRVMS